MTWDPDLTGDELLERADRPDPDDPTAEVDQEPTADPAVVDGPDYGREGEGNEVGPGIDPAEPFVPGGYGRAGWWFIRLSGLLLVVLLLGNVLTLHLFDGGVHGFNWGVLAARWASPWWRLWDVALIWLGLLHGGLGLRTVINDYSRRDGTRSVLTLLLGAVILVVAGLATLVIATFDPGI